MPGTIKIAILANAKSAVSEIKRTSNAAKDLGEKGKKAGSGLSGMVKGVAAAGAVAVVGDALRDGVKEATAFQDAAKQTDVALKGNKNLAGVTAEQVQKSSAALESLTGAKIDENDATLAANKLIRSGVTSQAALDRALAASADVALGTGKDIGGVSQALSKALANPAKAAGVLGKAGVVLSTSQKDAITAMAETGDTAGAQSAILTALESKYKGAGKAAGTGLSADLGRAQDALADSKREIATALMPALSTLASAFSKNLPAAMAVVTPVFKTFVGLFTNPAFLAFAGAIGAIVLGMKIYHGVTTVVSAATKIWAGFQWLLNVALTANPIGLIVLGIAALIAIIVLIATKTTWFQTIWKVVWGAIKTAAMFVFDFLKAYFVGAFNFFKGVFMAGVAAFKAVWGGIQWLWDKAVAVFNAIKGFIVGVFDWVKGRFENFIANVKVTWGKIMTLVDKAIEFKNKVVDTISGLIQKFKDIAGSIINGFIDGIKAGWNKVTDFFKGAIELIPDGIRSALGIGSPSKVMAGIGANIVDGLASGIKRQVPAVGKAMGVVSAAVNSGVAAKATVNLGTTGRVTATTPVLASAGGPVAPGIVVNISVAAGADPAEVGRQAVVAIEAYERRTGRRVLAPAIMA